MILDNELITGRPKELMDIEYYTNLPPEPVVFNYETLPAYLNFDLQSLYGIMPKTLDLIETTGNRIFLNKLSKEVVDYYKAKGTQFQFIHVVANIHTFRRPQNEKYINAYPYSISIVAGPKRGIPDIASIERIEIFDFDKISSYNFIYTDFSPFKPVETGFFTQLGVLNLNNHYTDTIGFILESYFLATDVDYLNDNIPMTGPQNINQEIGNKYDKYRIKRYFKPFTDIKPRKIWGCDSPIELFLIQGLAKKGVFPVIQTLIFKDGSIFDNYYQMVENNLFIKGNELITEVDLYFPREKLAIFCDSTQFHRNKVKQSKDTKINDELLRLGIKVIRLQGKEIVDNLNSCVNRIIDALK